MAAPLQWLDAHPLDAVFAWLLTATLQASVIVLVIFAARAALRHRLSPDMRYALWLLLALPLAGPLVRPLLPQSPIRFPGLVPPKPAPAFAPVPHGGTAPPAADSLQWRVEYEPLSIPPAPSLSRSEPVNGFRLSAMVWVVGATVLALRVAITHARAVWHARRAAPLTDPSLARLLDQCRRTVRTRRTVGVVAAPEASGPALLGVLRPRLLLPPESLQRLSPSELRFVLLHELVHLKRADVLSEWLLTLLQIVHWFSPLVWLAASRCRADREIACDAAVLALTGEAGRADYGRTILKLATGLPPRRFSPAAVGILETQSPLERRLRMIAAAPRTPGSRWPAPLVATVALALVACTSAPTPDSTEPARPPAPSSAKAAPGANAPPGADRTVAEDRDDPKNAAARAKLDRVLPEVTFDAVPFTDAIDHLRDVSGANVFVNWRALENAGVDRKVPVSVRMRDIRFGKALTIVLDSVSGGIIPLGYTVDDGVVTISTGEDLDRNTITRVYDIRDLIIAIPDYDPPATDEPPARPRPDDPGARERAKIEADHAKMVAQQKQIDELISLITNTVSPDSWRDAGGSTGSIREIQGQLIITQTPENQRQIVALLGQLRETRAIQVSIETRLIAADDELLEALPPGLRRKIEGQLRAAKDPVPAEKAPPPGAAPARQWEKTPAPAAAGNKSDEKDPAGVYLNAAEVDQVLRALQGSARSNIITAPRVTLFNGQGAYVLIASQRAYVADYTIVKQPDGKTTYEPLVGTAQAGIMFWARATASADRQYATVSLHPRFTQLAGLNEIPWHQQPAAGAAGEDLKVQRPSLLVSELRLTTTIPNGQTLLLGGLKGSFAPDPEKPAANQPPGNVIMLVKPTVIVHREIEAKDFPLVSPREEKPGR